MPQDAKPNVKGTKKLPKAALPIGAVAVVLLVLYLRKKSASSETSTSTNQEQLNRQSFIPVTGENVAGVGAGGSVGSGSGESSNTLMEFFKSQQEENKETRQSEHEWLREVLANLGTGGGAPTTGAPPGVTAAPPPAAGTPPGPSAPAPGPAPKAASCPSSFPHANGAPSPHTCYKDMTCPNGCPGHRYQDGHAECQSRNSKHQCTW